MNRRALPILRLGWPLLLAALLLAQALGLVHRVLHAPAGAVVSAHAADEAHGFGHDAGDPQCRLYDQLAGGDLACGAPAGMVPTLRPAEPVSAPPAGRLAPQASGFLARGPPSLTA